MRLELTGRHVSITPTLRRVVDAKLAKLERLLADGALSAQAVLTREKYRHRADITLHARGEKFLHGVGAAPTCEQSINAAIEKIQQQAQKVKGKWQERKRRGRKTEAVAEPVEVPVPRRRATERVRMPRILRASRQALKAMSVGEAAREVDASRDGLVVFRDAETSMISVLFRRPDGELTLVETEI